jgi:hypothetical protein
MFRDSFVAPRSSSCEASSKASWSLPQRSPWQLRAALGLAFGGGCGDGYSNGMNGQSSMKNMGILTKKHGE